MACKTTEALISIINKWPLNAESVPCKNPDGTYRTCDGATLRSLSVVRWVDSDSGDVTFNVTHRPTGYALLAGYHDVAYAILGIQLVYETLGDLEDPFATVDTAQLAKSRIAKRIHKFLARHCRVWNNAELERSIGVFYQDRAQCERLRHAINPKAPKQYLDPWAHDERMVADSLLSPREGR